MNERNKQVIVARRDLAMPPGKLAAQVAHASLGAILQHSLYRSQGNVLEAIVVDLEHSPLKESKGWFTGSFTKVVLGVDCLDELMMLHVKALQSGLPCVIIEDEGRTTFNKPTITTLGIGPALYYKIDEITGHLKLY